MRTLFWTAPAFFFRVLSDWGSLSDSARFLFRSPVRWEPSFGQRSLSFSASCPIGALFRTALAFFFRVLSDWGSLSDSARFLFRVLSDWGSLSDSARFLFPRPVRLGTLFQTALRTLFTRPVRLGLSFRQRSLSFSASCPMGALFRTALAFFLRVLSDGSSLLDSARFLFTRPVRLGLSFGQRSLSFYVSCPMGALFWTALAFFFRVLSDWGSLSDSARFLFRSPVQWGLSFGQRSLSFYASCPMGALFWTALAFFFRVLSDGGSLLDSARFLFLRPVRWGLSFGQRSLSFYASCPMGALFWTALAFFFRVLSDGSSLSDSARFLFTCSVRWELSFGQRSLSFSASCPNFTFFTGAVH